MTQYLLARLKEACYLPVFPVFGLGIKVGVTFLADQFVVSNFMPMTNVA